ncbi:MAG: hypothetical protein JJT75_12505 [Opitutales bacterium]|nr:hypothetical protein [Opitutales bacterium]MCH8541758.1 hypothetical protein [Opitutales bacterium]
MNSAISKPWSLPLWGGVLLLLSLFLWTGCQSREPGTGSKHFPERVSDWSIVEEDGVFYAEAQQWEGTRFLLQEAENPALAGLQFAPTRTDFIILFYTPEPRAEAAEIRGVVINLRNRNEVANETWQYINRASSIPQPRWSWGARRLIVEHPGMAATQTYNL